MKPLTFWIDNMPDCLVMLSVFAVFALPAEGTALESTPDAQNATQRLAQFALTARGNSENGAKLFRDARTKCLTCHRVGNEGGSVGPDLSSVGGKFDRPHLIDALLYPSRQIGYGYETTVIVTKDGKSTSGIVKETSDTHLTLLNSKNEYVQIPRINIDEASVSRTSIMPKGLSESISDQEFVDLITYMESLGRSRGRFGSGVSGPVQLPDEFQLTTVATGLSGAVAMEIAPDGRIFICEQGGTLWSIRDSTAGTADGDQDKVSDAETTMNSFVKIPVQLNWERGLIGVTVAPDFPATPWVYVVYVADTPYPHHRVSRFLADGDSAVSGSEEILFRGDDQRKFGGNRPAGHQGGAIHFGPDGKLYVGLGEQTAREPAQQMNALQGKILRINPDGSIPLDNPFVDSTKGKYKSIWAKGCRNPFTFAFSQSGEMLINDVGGRFEEINRGVAGANYGWPEVDHGPSERSDIAGPIHSYPQSCINGGDFCAESHDWPARFRGKYFFADFNQGWVRYIDPSDSARSIAFLSGIRRPVDLRFAPNGDLYVLLRNAWVVDENFKDRTGALVRISRRKSERTDPSEVDSAGDQTFRTAFWYGDRQSFGHRGHPQRWVNVLGHVSSIGDGKLQSLKYQLNAGPEKELSFEGGPRRLRATGDFNVELNKTELRPGLNEVTVIASGDRGETRSKMTIDFHEKSVRWPMPYEIRWSDAHSIQDVAQVVDGHWKITPDGVRTVNRHYDRIIAFGDDSWQDYELTTTVTIHALTPPNSGLNTTGVTHAALTARWPGHDPDGRQPSIRWWPLGATAEFRMGGKLTQCRWRIFDIRRAHYAESKRRRTLKFETPYRMKLRVVTVSDTESRYSSKLWPADQAEPPGWDLQRTEPENVPTGSALLVAHFSDVTFGDVSVRPVQVQQQESK